MMFFPINVWIVMPLVIITLMLASLVKAKKAKLIIIVIMTVFIVMEIISIYFSGGFIDYQFFVNLNINDIWEGLLIFKLQALLTVVVFFSFIFLLTKLSVICQNKINVQIRLMILVIMAMSLNYHHGPFDKLTELYQVTSAPKQDFSQALATLKMQDYPHKDQLSASKGKNIIVISLESFEQGFLDFNQLTPNLNQLRQKYDFYGDIPMGKGSSWTTASMYTYMTGIPFLVGGIRTMPFAPYSQTQLVTLPDVLHKADYQTRYIIGGPTFAGIGHVISMFDVDIISEANYQGQYPQAPFGLYDKDIFAIAKRQINELSDSDKPFALFISTISTHAPSGFYDQRMEKVIDKRDDNMEFVAASLDYNLGQFMNYLEEKGLLENTVFYIFPDHLMMGAGTPTIAKLSEKPRSLYLITNANKSDLGQYAATPNNIYQLDMPRIILNGADVKSNAKFWTDYLNIEKGNNRAEYVEQVLTNLATLNRSAALP